MLRITTSRHAENGHESTTTLRLEGRLSSDSINSLIAACDLHTATSASLTLDLAGVTYIDDRGVAAVRALRQRQVRVRGCSPFVRELLKECLT